MLKRKSVSAALTGLALAAALCACGSATQHTTSAGAGAGSPSSTTAPASPSPTGRSSSPAPASTAPASTAPASTAPVSTAPVAAAPVILAVRLSHGFQPSTLRISPGQRFVVTVDSSVKASGPGVPSSCTGTTTRIYGGMLTLRCVSGAFYYTAQHPGTAELMVAVRPNCAKGSMCPQWIAEATLKITIL